jgi:hypothetical protein
MVALYVLQKEKNITWGYDVDVEVLGLYHNYSTFFYREDVLIKFYLGFFYIYPKESLPEGM